MTWAMHLKNAKFLAVSAAAGIAFLLWSAPMATAAPGEHQALRLMGKSSRARQNTFMSLKKLPDRRAEASGQAGSAAPDQFGQSQQRQKGAEIFFDMKREVEVESDTWHGSTGLQINW